MCIVQYLDDCYAEGEVSPFIFLTDNGENWTGIVINTMTIRHRTLNVKGAGKTPFDGHILCVHLRLARGFMDPITCSF